VFIGLVKKDLELKILKAKYVMGDEKRVDAEI
jgi:hypothetical protein